MYVVLVALYVRCVEGGEVITHQALEMESMAFRISNK